MPHWQMTLKMKRKNDESTAEEPKEGKKNTRCKKKFSVSLLFVLHQSPVRVMNFFFWV